MKQAVAVLLLVLVACSSVGQTRVIVAAGTTLVDSGLLDELAATFEAGHPDIELSVVGEATAQVLELGRRGGADVLITHAPALEAAFVGEGLAARYELVLTSSFVIVGPPDGVPDGGTVAEVLRSIAGQGGPFVSRADGSGTHEMEVDLWEAAGVEPGKEPWYIETGQGMGLTLQVADQRDAYTLSELGAFLAASDALTLEPLDVTGIPANPYHLIVVAASSERSAGEEFLDWLLAPEGSEAVARLNQELFGRSVYEPTD
ncbi:MAG: extracellular solute-binding protein [Acidimicrobiia bacterium]|nr:extracellular solute-binding protein [Acidimicrobiia bacterium]